MFRKGFGACGGCGILAGGLILLPCPSILLLLFAIRAAAQDHVPADPVKVAGSEGRMSWVGVARSACGFAEAMPRRLLVVCVRGRDAIWKPAPPPPPAGEPWGFANREIGLASMPSCRVLVV